uniref:Uncharacterized protein n=1 Tax=Utricularia reniformis TaxID=192314 RepID=A0A1Y0B3R6_9LAMI|nr:hypothetical protein AEK19_MT1931 [Utricularia reniformis]ART32096.1 hypothetical protein AEK19_MT1931 [Utricularia reniformis]
MEIPPSGKSGTKAGNMSMLLPARMVLPAKDYARKVGDKQEAGWTSADIGN